MKIEKDYKDKWGKIPKDLHGRLSLLLLSLKNKKSKKSISKLIKSIKDIEWLSYKFTIYLLPKATPRPRLQRFGGTFYVAGAHDNKKIVKKYLKDNPHDIIHTPMIFHSKVYLPTPNSMSIEDKILAEMGYIRPISKPDFDNVAKTYADMIQDSLILDDALIITGISEKYYSIKPRIEISIKYMKEFDSLFNKKKIDKRGITISNIL